MKHHDQDNSYQKEFNRGLTSHFRGLVHVHFSGMWWQAGMSLEQQLAYVLTHRLQAKRETGYGMVWAFGTPRPTTSYTPTPTRPHLSILPK